MQTNKHFLSYPAEFFLQLEIFQTDVEEKLETHILCPITFFFNRCLYEKMRKNMVQADRLQLAIWRMRVARWIPKASNTHSELAIFNVFPLQQWLNERTSVLPYTCIACLVFSSLTILSALPCISQRTQPVSIIKINQDKISYTYVGFHVKYILVFGSESQKRINKFY